MHADGCIEEKGRATGRWRKQSHLGTPDLVLLLGARHRDRKKRRDIVRGVGGCAQQGRAIVKGRKRGVIVGAVMRLDLGFVKVQREKGGMLTQDQNSHVDLIT